MFWNWRTLTNWWARVKNEVTWPIWTIFSLILSPSSESSFGSHIQKLLDSNSQSSTTKFCSSQQRTWSNSLVFRNYFFLWISTLESPNQKTELDGMFIFWCWFFDFFSFWPIKSADLQNPGFQSKIWTWWHVQKYLISIGDIILWHFRTTFVKMHELRASVHTRIMVFFRSAR